MTRTSTVPRGCVVCGAEHPDPHDEAAHAAHEETIRRRSEEAAREELARAGVEHPHPLDGTHAGLARDCPECSTGIPETEQRTLWGDR